MFHKSYINDFVMKKYNETRGYLELLKIKPLKKMIFLCSCHRKAIWLYRFYKSVVTAALC